MQIFLRHFRLLHKIVLAECNCSPAILAVCCSHYGTVPERLRYYRNLSSTLPGCLCRTSSQLILFFSPLCSSVAVACYLLYHYLCTPRIDKRSGQALYLSTAAHNRGARFTAFQYHFTKRLVQHHSYLVLTSTLTPSVLSSPRGCSSGGGPLSTTASWVRASAFSLESLQKSEQYHWSPSLSSDVHKCKPPPLVPFPSKTDVLAITWLTCGYCKVILHRQNRDPCNLHTVNPEQTLLQRNNTECYKMCKRPKFPASLQEETNASLCQKFFPEAEQ